MKKSEKLYSPEEMIKSFGLNYLHSYQDRNNVSPFYMRVSIAVCEVPEQTKKLA